MICADRTTPEIAAALHAGGAEMIVIPSGGAFGPVRNDHPVTRSRDDATAAGTVRSPG